MIIAPSVLSLDFSKWDLMLDQLHKSDAKWLHFDVMDGHFVPNLTFGPDILNAFKKNSYLYMDVHLMVSDPDFFSKIFIDNGADNITFHIEAIKDDTNVFKLIEKIKKSGCNVGISIKPNTNIDRIIDFLPYIDLVLVMSVEPGFGGQKFMPEVLPKISKLKEEIIKCNSKALIEVDGGINFITAKQCKNAGADVLVAGSYIFKNNIIDAVKSLC
ncbi:MAG: ribulose-phosphate 3-epimerase [Anaerorhabdus sp.]